MLGTHIPEAVVMGPRNGVPATRASRGAPRGDDSLYELINRISYMVPATQQRPRPQQSRRRPRRWLSRLAWVLALAILVVLVLPYLLVPLYRTVNPISTLMLWRWATGARVERSFVPIDRMAPALPMTVIASEDGRFCSHRGIDWRELRERLEDVDDISAARAVSTITQQTAKNLFLWPGRSFVRKALELPLALWIDFVLPKRRV